MAENVEVMGTSAIKVAVIGTVTGPDICGISGVVGLSFFWMGLCGRLLCGLANDSQSLTVSHPELS